MSIICHSIHKQFETTNKVLTRWKIHPGLYAFIIQGQIQLNLSWINRILKWSTDKYSLNFFIFHIFGSFPRQVIKQGRNRKWNISLLVAGDFSRYILVSFQRSKKTSNGFFGFQSMNFLALIIQDSSCLCIEYHSFKFLPQ